MTKDAKRETANVSTPIHHPLSLQVLVPRRQYRPNNLQVLIHQMRVSRMRLSETKVSGQYQTKASLRKPTHRQRTITSRLASLSRTCNTLAVLIVGHHPMMATRVHRHLPRPSQPQVFRCTRLPTFRLRQQGLQTGLISPLTCNAI